MSNTIDRNTVRDLANDIETALTEIFNRHGLTTPTVSATYTPNSVRFRLDAAIDATNDAGVNTAAPEAVAYQRNGSRYGLNADLLGSEFNYAGRTFKFIGIKTSRPKFPISAIDTSNGKEYKLPIDAVEAINAAA